MYKHDVYSDREEERHGRAEKKKADKLIPLMRERTQTQRKRDAWGECHETLRNTEY